jgi:phosphoenolpyruvate phosphomutase
VRVDNDRWAETGEAASLALAAERLAGPCLVGFGDLLCRRHILQALLDDPADLVIAADRNIRRDAGDAPRARDVVKLSAGPAPAFLDAEITATAATFTADTAAFDAEWTGLLKCSAQGALWLREALAQTMAKPGAEALGLTDVLTALLAAGRPIKVHLVSGDWTTIENALDLAEASNL